MLNIQHNLSPASAYKSKRYDFLKIVEGEVLYAYGDSKGIPTIGIGINLGVHGELVLAKLGFDLKGTTLTGAALTAEQGYISDLINAFGATYAIGTAANPPNATLDALNKILDKRAKNTAANYPSDFTRVTQFQLSAGISEAVLNQVLDGYTNPATGDPFEGYEKTVTKWLNISGIDAVQPGLGAADSLEHLVLVSLAFNSAVYRTNDPNTPWNDVGLPTLLGPSLAKALLNDDRAEAWFQIRYQSGQTLAERRFVEADAFGLYNDPSPMSDNDAKGAFRTYTRHRSVIDAFESDPSKASDIQSAVNRGVSLSIPVARLADKLAPARDYLRDRYFAPFISANLDGTIVVGESDGTDGTQDTRYFHSGSAHPDADAALAGSAKNDLIFGESGDDVLQGGQGDDCLIGGSGDDTLEGGAGKDVYAFTLDGMGRLQGRDTIRDADGKGSIVVSGVVLNGAAAEPYLQSILAPNPAWRLRVNGQDLYLTLVDQNLVDGRGRLWIEGSSGEAGGRIVIENFKNGELGLLLPTSNLGALTTFTPSALSPFVDPGHVPETQTTDLDEGHVKVLGFAIDSVPGVARVVRIAADAYRHVLSIIKGDDTISLADGYVDIPLAAGQTQLVFGLLNSGDVDTDALVNLTAQLLPLEDGSGGTQLATLHINLHADREPEGVIEIVTDPVAIHPDPTNAPLYDGSSQTNDLIILDDADHDAILRPESDDRVICGNLGTLVETRVYLNADGTPTAPVTSYGSKVVGGGTGNDVFRLSEGADWLMGGAGKDIIVAGGGDDLLEGGSGDDFLAGNEGRDRLFADTMISESAAIALGATQPGIEAEQDLEAQRANLISLTAAINELTEQRKSVHAEAQRATTQSIAELQQRLSATRQELIKAKSVATQQTLIAPVDGVVQQLKVHTIGGVVTPAEALMIIVPDGQALEVEAQVLNRDIGFVSEGQVATVKVDAFPFTRYGSIAGELLTVSNDAAADEHLGLVYPSRVKLQRTSMRIDAKEIVLTPGMAVTVEIKTGRRRLIDYFVAPVTGGRREHQGEMMSSEKHSQRFVETGTVQEVR